MALHLATRHPEKFAGVIALSCYLPLAREFATERSSAQSQRRPSSWRTARRIRWCRSRSAMNRAACSKARATGRVARLPDAACAVRGGSRGHQEMVKPSFSQSVTRLNRGAHDPDSKFAVRNFTSLRLPVTGSAMTDDPATTRPAISPGRGRVRRSARTPGDEPTRSIPICAVICCRTFTSSFGAASRALAVSARCAPWCTGSRTTSGSRGACASESSSSFRSKKSWNCPHPKTTSWPPTITSTSRGSMSSFASSFRPMTRSCCSISKTWTRHPSVRSPAFQREPSRLAYIASRQFSRGDSRDQHQDSLAKPAHRGAHHADDPRLAACALTSCAPFQPPQSACCTPIPRSTSSRGSG